MLATVGKKLLKKFARVTIRRKTCASTSRCASETNDTTLRLQQETMEGNDGYVDIIMGDPSTSFSNLNIAGCISLDPCYATTERSNYIEVHGDDIDTIDHEKAVDSDDEGQNDRNEWSCILVIMAFFHSFF